MKKYIFSTAEKRVDYKGELVYNRGAPKGRKYSKGIFKLWKLATEFLICGSAISAIATAFAPYAVTM